MSPTMALIDIGELRDELRYFVSVESDFYPDLGTYYEVRFDEYFAALSRADEDEHEVDDE